MHDLTVVGLSEDGHRLVLASASGEEFSVVVDDRLRAALRPFPTRPPAAPVAPGRAPRRERQLETSMDSALRPRDIQARIRSGESPETVAEAAGTTVDGIMAFAGPVLAERAHVAQLAQKASVRRRSGDAGGARVLGEAAEAFWAEHGLHEEDVEWDAWRRPDGRWALVATFALDGRPARAELTHDLPGRYVVAENDDARALTGELPAPGSVGAGGAGTPAPRRLSSVRFGDEVPLGDDAIELVRDPRPDEGTDRTEQAVPLHEDHAEEDGTDDVLSSPSATAGSSDVPDAADTEDAPTTVTAVDAPATTGSPATGSPVDPTDGRGTAPLPFDPAADTADADWLVAQDAPGRTVAPEAPDAPEAPADPAATAPAPTSGSAPTSPASPAAPVDDPAQEALPGTESLGEQAARDKQEKPAKRRSRSSVPSWDEIMFGGGKGD